MAYVPIGDKAAGSLEKRLTARPAHLERFTQLGAEGRLILAYSMPMAG